MSLVTERTFGGAGAARPTLTGPMRPSGRFASHTLAVLLICGLHLPVWEASHTSLLELSPEATGEAYCPWRGE